MKKMMIYDLWGILISYSLLFNGYNTLGLLVEILVLIYNLMFVRRINYWRFTSILLLTSIFTFIVTYNSSIISNKLIVPFLLLVCVNSSIVNEITYKLKVNYIMPTYMILSISFLIFGIIALIIPYSSLLPNYKANLYTYIALIFIPSFISMSICILTKVLNKKEIKTNYVLK